MQPFARDLGNLASVCLGIAVVACAAAACAQDVVPAQPAAPSIAPPVPVDPVTSSPADEPNAAAGDADVRFFSDIMPILFERCVKCHGPQKRSGGLRLDTKALAARGGDSGRPVLGGSPQDNELLARVSSTDRTYRMPKNAPALPGRETDILRRWVEQGTPWPASAPPPERTPYQRWLDELAAFSIRYEGELSYAMPYAIGFLALNVALLIVLRCRAAYQNGSRWLTGRLAWFGRFCAGVKPREVLLVMALSLAGIALAVMRGRLIEVETELAAVTPNRESAASPWSNTIYGFPPKPIRPDHPKQVAGTYYRGNCERNPSLFNGGNYLTATFHVSLCDAQRRQLDVDKPIPPDGIFVRLEIERAPGTTDLLFSDELMASVALTKNFYDSADSLLRENPVRLETIEANKRWVASFPIGKPTEKPELDGVIYIYTGTVDDKTFSGTLQYGIQYQLRFTGGKLSPESDLWMDSFGNGAFANPIPPGKLPYREWFDYRPMPVISGENTSDPELLGVDEYVRKGLIAAPEKSPSDERSPSSTSSDNPDGK